MDQKTIRKNLWFFPLGTFGRDMVYSLFTNFLMTYILFTRELTNGQLVAISAIMIAARIFDALNDPIMGNIIERTRTKHGKFKPWLVIGIITTSFVVYAAFNSKLQGWKFIAFFGVIYFLYSITYTMHDISYWGMVPALSSDAHLRDQFTSRTNLFAGFGGAVAGFLIPMLTTGSNTLGGNASFAFGKVALAVSILAPAFLCFTIFGVREDRSYNDQPAPPISLKKVIDTVKNNDQLLWISAAFIIQQVGNDLAVGGLGSFFIYFDLGYEGGYYSNFSTFGLAATAILMIIYPMIAKKIRRKPFMKDMLFVSAVGYLAMILIGIFMPSTNPNLKCWIFTFAFMIANFGIYAYYLIMMISIMNTVEYNELKYGERNEAIISSARPFITKFASAIVVGINTLVYIIFGVRDYTNQIAQLEQQMNQGKITEAAKLSGINDIIANVGSVQKIGLLLCLTVLPFLCMVFSYLIYKKHYTLDEDRYEEICQELNKQA